MDVPETLVPGTLPDGQKMTRVKTRKSSSSLLKSCQTKNIVFKRARQNSRSGLRQQGGFERWRAQIGQVLPHLRSSIK
jgi:hypothetical protein